MLARSIASLRHFSGAFICAVFLSIGLTAASITSAPSAHAQAATDISKAYFATGWFEKNPSGEWDEYDGQGNLRYTFREVGRTDSAIKLYLKQYGVTVELETAEQRIYAEWPGKARHVMHRITNMEIMAPPPVMTPEAPPPPSAATAATVALATHANGSFVKSGETWTEIARSGARNSYREIGRDNDRVFLYDAARRSFVILDIPGRMILGSNGGAMTSLYPVSEYSVISAPQPRPVETPVAPRPPEPEPEFPEPPKLSTLERATCIATGGTVEQAGILGAERCTRPYHDGGMVCSDSSQCQGKCIADLNGANQSAATGTCQKTDNPFGCYAEVRNGQTGPALCVD